MGTTAVRIVCFFSLLALGCSPSAGGSAVTSTDAAVSETFVARDTSAGELTDVTTPRDVASLDGGKPNFDGGASDASTIASDRGVTDVPVSPVDTGVSVPPGRCLEPVSPTSTGPLIELDTLHFNWSMQCYEPADGSLFVFVEDTKDQHVALRFYNFLNHGGPATGDTIDLAQHLGRARPFFLSMISGIETEPTWRYERDYLAYSGQVIVHRLQRQNPVGTTLRVELRDLRAREVRNYTDGRCESVPNGARIHVRSLILELPVNDLHRDQDCIDWAGG